MLVGDFDIVLDSGTASSAVAAAAVEAELLRAAHEALVEAGV